MVSIGDLVPKLQRLAWRLQGNSAHGAADAEDLVSVASMEVLRARMRFDPERGASWHSFALLRAGGAMRDELRRLDYVPRKERSRLREEGGDPRRMFSLFTAHFDDVPPELPDDGAVDPVGEAAREDFWDRVRQIVGARSAGILERHIRGDYPFHQIGGELGISESRVSQLYRKALRKLRERLFA